MSPRRAALAGGAIALLILAWISYAGSFKVPFQFDDIEAIEANPTVKNLSLDALQPPRKGSGVTGRPVVNFSLAVNHAIGGTNPTGYHVFNVLVHGLSGLLLFGVVRRTLLQPALRLKHAPVASSVAWMAAALWLVHPLQTESVTGVIQRTELLVSLFFLLTLYGFVRSVSPAASRFWPVVTVGSCLLGMASKEVMVSAPLIVFLYDRTFAAGSFRDAWRRRRPLHSALAGTWILLAVLVAGGGGARGVAAGFGLGVTPLDYAMKQCEAIPMYLGLAVWPYPLVVDYGSDVIVDPVRAMAGALLLAALVAGTVFALFRRPVAGFLGGAFFALLAPSSSIVPLVTQTMAEHRMYLPLAAIIVPAAALVERGTAYRRLLVLSGLATVLALAGLTRLRNHDYRSGIALWQDTVTKRPGNPRAWQNLGVELSKDKARIDEAMACFRRALSLDPNYADSHFALGTLLARSPGTADEAIGHLADAVKIAPNHVEANFLLANELSRQPGRLPDAILHYDRVLELDPDNAAAHNNLATALRHTPGRSAEAVAHYERSLQLRPNHPDVHFNLANVLANSPDGIPAALHHYSRALQLKPGFVAAHYNLANELAKLPGRLPEAIEHYEAALRIQPEHVEAHFNLAIALAKSGRIAESIQRFEIVLRLNPESVLARQYIAALESNPR